MSFDDRCELIGRKRLELAGSPCHDLERLSEGFGGAVGRLYSATCSAVSAPRTGMISCSASRRSSARNVCASAVNASKIDSPEGS